MLPQDTALHALRSDLEIRLKRWDQEGFTPYYSLTLKEGSGIYGGVTIYLSPEQVAELSDTLHAELEKEVSKADTLGPPLGVR